MRRYKIVACILLILSVFGFVLAAPVAVQEVHEAYAAAVDGGENVIIRVGPGKRADVQEEEDPLLARAQQEPSSSSSVPNYASGTPPDPPFSSSESKLPLWITGVPSRPGRPAPSSKALSSKAPSSKAPSSKAKSVSWAPWKEVKLPSGRIYREMLLPPGLGPEKYQPNQPASSSPAKSVSLPLTKEVQLPSGEIYSEVLPPEMAAQELPPEPQSENIFSKLVGKLKFKPWRRIPELPVML
jgi:hypothetical protein